MEFFNLLMDDRMIIIFEKLPLFFVFFVFIFAQDFLCWTVLHFIHDYLSIGSESSRIYILDMTDFQIGDWRPSNLSPSASVASLSFSFLFICSIIYIMNIYKKIRKKENKKTKNTCKCTGVKISFVSIKQFNCIPEI